MSKSIPPTHEDLQLQLELLKEEYIKLLNDKDVLLHWGKPQLEALYATRIGRWQLERLQLQLRIRALKRKIEMVHSAMARQVEIDVNSIEMAVAIELAEAEHTILQQTAELEKAYALLSHLDTPQRSAELRTLYRQFAKQLHPDVAPERTGEQEQLWHLVKDAYEAGDLEKLKALQLVYEKELNAAANQTDALSVEELSLRTEVLKEGIKVLQEQLRQIRSSFPFTIEQQLKDEDWVAAETATLQEELNALNQYEEELSLEYRHLISAL